MRQLSITPQCQASKLRDLGEKQSVDVGEFPLPKKNTIGSWVLPWKPNAFRQFRQAARDFERAELAHSSLPLCTMSELDAGEKALARLYMAGCFHQWGVLPGEHARSTPKGQSLLQ